MEAYRLARKKYGIQLSSRGAALRGGRWNSRGTEMIYTANSRALAMAEVAVYLSLETLPDDYMMLSIGIPKSVKIHSLDHSALPSRWNIFPHLPDTQEIGDRWVMENKTCVLKVPSAVVPGDYNFLINPSHKDFALIQLTGHCDFPFDRRIF